MSTNQFLSKNVNGKTELRTAIETSSGAGDANKIIQTDSTGRIDPSFMPTGIGADTETITVSEPLTAGDFVNIYDDTGRTARLADVDNGRVAHGFVLESVSNGQDATIYKGGTNTALSGLAPGAEYFLTNGGDATTTPAIANPAQIIQSLGYASDAGELVFTFQSPTLIV